jgi:hypothetical protein
MDAPQDEVGSSDELTSKQRLQIEKAFRASQEIAQRISAVLGRVDASTLTFDDFLELRSRLGELEAEMGALGRVISKQFGFGSARASIRQFLLNHLGEIVNKDQIAGVACVMEWARRVRELDVQEGWKIASGPGTPDLRPGEYRLESETPDGTAARRWKLLNSIRRTTGSAQDRMLLALRTMHPESVSRDDLDYVAKIRSRDRRKRDLEEAGWDISSYEDDPSLPKGHYRLNSLDKRAPRNREAIKRRYEILQERDFTCEACGVRPESGKRPVFLQVHHKTFVRHHGKNEPENYEVRCRACHAGVHAVTEDMVEDELLNPAAVPFLES